MAGPGASPVTASTSTAGTTHGVGPDSFPEGDWSPDGTTIALIPPNSSDVVELYSASGMLLVEYPVDGARNAARYSPDGTTLALLAGERISIALLDIGTGMVRALTSPPENQADGNPRWSPDGSRVLFERSGSPFTLQVVDVATGEEQFVAEREQGVRWRWTPSSELLALPDDVELSPDGVRRASSCTDAPLDDADTCANRVYVDGVKVFDGAHRVQGVAWSPDGTQLGVTSDGLHVVDLRGGGSRRIADGSFFPPKFTPAGPRFAGSSRIETSVSISRAQYGTAGTVVLARADDFADALGGAPLAGLLDAPLLLSGRDQLSPAVQEELQRLGAREALLLGGETALSPAIEAQLSELGLATRRLAGRERFATGAAITREVLELGGADQAYVVAGRSFADALAVGSLAAATGRPVVLTEADRLPPQSADAVAGVETATVIGGPAAVSPAVEDDLEQAGAIPERIAGTDRYETSAKVLDAAVTEGLAGGVWLVTGRDFPDALAAAPAAAVAGAQLLLVDGQSLPQVSLDVLARHRAVLDRMAAVGGPDVVGPAAVQDAVRALSPR